ncbi:MAG: hypothetical protein HEQ40_02335 [Lacibacter sp.]|jgi:hypothetical protein
MLSSAQKYGSKRKLRLIPDIISGWKTIAVLFSVTVFFGLLIWWLNKNPVLEGLWNNFIIDKRVPASFCEQVHINSLFRQPVNSFSNIVYLLTAVIILSGLWKSRHANTKGHLSESNIFCVLFSIVLLYVFVASTFYHASLIGIAHTLDYSAVFSFSLFPFMYFLYQWWLLKKKTLSIKEKQKSEIRFLLLFSGANLGLTLLTPKGKEQMVAILLVLLFLASAIITVIIEKHKPGTNYLIYTIIAVIAAVILFEFDKYKIVCNPKSIFQPHSLWNIFIGLSAFWFYLYMRSETTPGALIVKLKQ